MMRSEFRDAIRRIAPDLAEEQVSAIVLAGDEYAAHIAEKAARPPDWPARRAS
jgi:hypothetical protein